jgi:hypothetical protein
VVGRRRVARTAHALVAGLVVKPPVVKKIDNMAKVVQAIDLLATSSVQVGIPSEENKRQGGKITNAEIGYIHENGAPEAGIPARPHMGPGVRNVQGRINQLLKNAARLAFAGKPEGVVRALHAVGLTAQASIRSVITAGIPPPLRPGTLAARRRRGRKGTTPLIDTGQYRNAITYVIRKKGK